MKELENHVSKKSFHIHLTKLSRILFGERDDRNKTNIFVDGTTWGRKTHVWLLYEGLPGVAELVVL